MNRWRQRVLALALAGGCVALADDPSVSEVRALLRANLEGVTDAELDQAALSGLFKHFEGRVILLTNGAPVFFKEDANEPVVSKAAVYEEAFGYLRIGRAGEGLAAELDKKYRELSAAYKLKGLVLDLRFAGGKDFKQAAAAADLFIESAAPLLEWKGEVAKALPKTNALPGPVVVLVNRATRGAPELLAAVLREQRVGLLIGSSTAGQVAEMTEFKLKTGQTLKVATATVKVGGKMLPAKGIKPDITVQVPENDELAYLGDPFQAPLLPALTASTATNTSRLFRPRVNEADLVRMKREGHDLETEPEARPVRPGEQIKNLVRDPALARALDLLKGLNLIKWSRTL